MTDNKSEQSNKTESRFFYGYVIVPLAFLALLVMGGIVSSFGVFFKPLLNEFGWTRTVIAGAFSLQVILQGLLFILSGRLNDRFGPRIVLSGCGFFLGSGILLMSQVKAIWHVYLYYGVLAGIGMGFLWVPVLSTVARWFVKRRGLMTGIVATGLGVGVMITPPAATWVISNYGWRTSYATIGFLVLIVIIGVAQFLKRDPSVIGQLPDGEKAAQVEIPELAVGGLTLQEAMHTRYFWLFGIAYSGYSAFLTVILVHIVPHAIEFGISAAMAATILSLNGGVSILGRVGFGSLGDRFGNKSALVIAFLLTTAALIWLLMAEEMKVVYLFAIIFGLGQGGLTTMQSPATAWLFGLRSHGAIFGMVSFFMAIGAALGPLLVGYIFDVTGRYQTGFLVCAVISGAGLMLSSFLTPPQQS